MRIDKLLADLKYGSRTDVKKIIMGKHVLINGILCDSPKVQIDPICDTITINGEAVFYKDPIHLAFYKPQGYLSAHKDSMHRVLFTLLKEPYKRFDFHMAGRLDLDSEGLMILSTDGQFIHQITHPKRSIPKVYETVVDKHIDNEDIEILKSGVVIKDQYGKLYQAKAIELACLNDICHIMIDEGKFHQVKRMFKAVGYEVLNLKRISIGKLKLDLKPGTYREITYQEVLDD